MSQEIKECPECSHVKSESQECMAGPCNPDDQITWWPWYYRVCQRCGYSSGTKRSQKLADDEWNRRANVSIQTAQELADLLKMRMIKIGTDGHKFCSSCGCDYKYDHHPDCLIKNALTRFDAEKGRA